MAIIAVFGHMIIPSPIQEHPSSGILWKHISLSLDFRLSWYVYHKGIGDTVFHVIPGTTTVNELVQAIMNGKQILFPSPTADPKDPE